MPIGRMIRAKAIDDERLNSVSIEAEFLFWKFIVACDRDGRLKASPRYINKAFFGLRDYTDAQVEGWLHELWNCKKNGKGLVEIYEVEGRRYLWLPGFLHEQSGSWLKWVRLKEAPSIIPAPPTEQEKTKQGRGASAPLKQKLGEFLNVFLLPPEYEKLIVKFGETDTKERIDKLSTYKKSKGVNYKDDYATILNWSRRDKEKDGANRANPRAVLKPDQYTRPENLA